MYNWKYWQIKPLTLNCISFKFINRIMKSPVRKWQTHTKEIHQATLFNCTETFSVSISSEHFCPRIDVQCVPSPYLLAVCPQYPWSNKSSVGKINELSSRIRYQQIFLSGGRPVRRPYRDRTFLVRSLSGHRSPKTGPTRIIRALYDVADGVTDAHD